MSWEHTLCAGCGVNAWHILEDGLIVHEDFYVHDRLWNTACPDPAVVLCIGCLETRLGRRLTRDDFTGPPRTSTAPWPGRGVPPSRRFADRWAIRDEQLRLGLESLDELRRSFSSPSPARCPTPASARRRT